MGEREGIFALGCGRSRLDSVAVALWHLQAQDVVVWRKGWDPNSRWAREREIWRGRVLGARPDLVPVSGPAFLLFVSGNGKVNLLSSTLNEKLTWNK